MITHADRHIGISHRAAMFGRRVRQLGRVPGFTPVPNARIDAKIKTIEGILTLARQEEGREVDPVDIYYAARNEVARSLPPLPIGYKKHIVRPNTSKYNQENTKGNR